MPLTAKTALLKACIFEALLKLGEDKINTTDVLKDFIKTHRSDEIRKKDISDLDIEDAIKQEARDKTLDQRLNKFFGKLGLGDEYNNYSGWDYTDGHTPCRNCRGRRRRRRRRRRVTSLQGDVASSVAAAVATAAVEWELTWAWLQVTQNAQCKQA